MFLLPTMNVCAAIRLLLPYMFLLPTMNVCAAISLHFSHFNVAHFAHDNVHVRCQVSWELKHITAGFALAVMAYARSQRYSSFENPAGVHNKAPFFQTKCPCRPCLKRFGHPRSLSDRCVLVWTIDWRRSWLSLDPEVDSSLPGGKAAPPLRPCLTSTFRLLGKQRPLTKEGTLVGILEGGEYWLNKRFPPLNHCHLFAQFYNRSFSNISTLCKKALRMTPLKASFWRCSSEINLSNCNF